MARVERLNSNSDRQPAGALDAAVWRPLPFDMRGSWRIPRRLAWLTGTLGVLLCSSCSTPAPAAGKGSVLSTPPPGRVSTGHDPSPERRFEFTEPQMGMPFRLVMYADSGATATNAARAAFGRIAELNTILSDYEEDSELTRLSRTAGSGQWVPVSEDLWRVLTRGQEFARKSDGAFDMTIGPLVQQWRRAPPHQQQTPPPQRAPPPPPLGWRFLELDAKTRAVKLAVPRMRLDLGGIAKGYALQEALETLVLHGIQRALVSGSGDLVAGEAPPGKPGWRVEIAPLDAPNAPPARYVSLRRMALATSGDLFQHVEIDGIRYSHIVDPGTGVGLTDHSLVTVIAPDGMTADAMSTAVSVLGPARGMKLVEAERQAAAQIVRQPGTQLERVESRRLPRYLD
ncbi:MAG: FAD:protein FMN transferase [Limisphaerales bacterium]